MNKQRKTSHILNVFQYDADGHVVLPASLTLGIAPTGEDNSAKVPTTAWVRSIIGTTGASYVPTGRTITINGTSYDLSSNRSWSIDTGVLTASAGSGISVSVVSQNLNIVNTGLLTATSGSGISVSTVNQNLNIVNTGLLTATAGAGISVSTVSQNLNIVNTGLLTATAGSGITVSVVNQNLNVVNTGILTASAGSGISLSVVGQNLNVVNTGVLTASAGAGISLSIVDGNLNVINTITNNNQLTNGAGYITSSALTGYATETYVGTQISNLVDAAPGTLDTLNELAAALGDDPNFATTVSTSIGTKVPQTRTITINGTSYDLTANRSWTINSMVYPSAGIALSTGTAWGTSITDNSANWNTAFGWGNHASAGYLASATAATTYVSLTGSYANPSWITSLAYSKITGVPAFLTSYTETDTLASVTGRGASTSTALTLSGGATITGLTIAKSSGVSTITFPAGTNDPAFISHTESTANVGIMRFSVGDDNDTIDYFIFGNISNPDAFRINANGTVSIGTWQGTAIADTYISSAATWNAKQNALNGTGFVKISGTTISYDNNTYLTGITSTLVTNALGFTPYNSSNPSGYISSYTETDTLASVTGRGASTSTPITVTASEGREVAVYMPSSYSIDDLVSGHEYGWYNDHWRLGMTRSSNSAGSDFVIQWNAARRLSLTNGGNLTVTGTISASNFSGSSSGTNTGDQTNISGNSATTSQTNFSSLTVNSNVVLHAGNFSSYALRWNSTQAPANGLDNTGIVPNSVTLFDGYAARVPGYPSGADQWWVGALTIGDASRGFQIAGGYADSDMYFRKGNNTWAAWRKVWTDVNLTNLNQLTNGPGYITAESDTLATVTGRGATTSSNLTFSGQLTLNKNGTQLKISRADTVGADWFFHSWTSGINIYPNAAGTVYFGRDGSTTNVDVYNGTLYQQGNAVWHAGNLTNLNQLTNGPGYITSSANISGSSASAPILTASGSLTTQYGNGTIGYSYALTNPQTGLFSAVDNSNAIITINRHPDNYYSQLGFSSNGNLYYRSFSAAAINTSQGWQTIWTSNSLTNLNQLTNGPGYITGESDTLATVTSRGNTTNGSINVNGNILMTGTATTTNQARTIDFTGFDKEAVTDFSDRAYIQHTTNTGGHAGSVLVIASENDADDGIAFLTNASSKLKHNSNNIATESFVTSQGYITSSPLSSYLPLTGGSISGTLTTNGQLAVANNIVMYGDNKQIQWNAAASADLFISAIPGTRTIEIRNGNAASPNYAACGLITGYATFTSNVTVQGNITVSSSNTTGNGIILADDGDIVDLNDAYCSMRFSYGVRIYSANRGGSPVITLANTGVVTATTFSGALSGNATTASSISGFNNPTTAATANTIVYRDGSGDVAAREFVLTASTIHVDTPSSMLGIYPTTNQVVKFGSPAARNFLNVPTRTGGDASGTWGISISGNAATASYSSLDFRHSDRDFPTGTLVQTNINYAVSSGDAFILEIKGNSYFNTIPFDVQIQGYIYGDTIISTGGYSNGKYIDGIRAINHNGNLCFWWPSGGYWEGFNVKVYAAFASYPSNRVTSISNSAQPTTAKQVNFSPVQSLHSGNFNSYAPSLTGGNASGTWGINITGNAATATSATDSTKLPLAGGTLTGNLLFSNSGTTKRGIQGTCGDNDFWFIGGGATGSNAGFLEIATGDDGQGASAEPIYVSQYGPGDVLTGTLFRRATLLDASGNTSFPGTVTAPTFSGSLSGNATNITAYTINQSVGTGNTPSFAGATLGCGVATGRSGYAPGTLNLVLLSSTAGSDGVSGIDFRSGNNYPSDGASIYYENSQTGSGEVSRLVFRTENDLNDSILMRAGYHVYNARTVDNASQGVDNPIFRWQYLDSNRMTLDSSGNLVCNGDVTAYSDARIKTNVHTIENALDKTLRMRGVSYNRTDGNDASTKIGVIAQEVIEILPEVVHEQSDGMLGVSYGNIVGVLIEAIKEQQKQIEDLTNKIDLLTQNK
jgi:hypothetical protein